MLILVGVTINVAIQGGLFGTAQEAKQKMGREISREKLIAATVGAYDSNGYFVKANVVLPEGMSWDTENTNWVIDENGERFYIDPSNGAVLDEEPQGKTYSFTLNQLEPALEIDSDSVVCFDNTAFWNKVSNGIDLSKDPAYSLFDGAIMIVETTDSRFQDFYAIGLGIEELLESTQYTVIIGPGREALGIQIMTRQGEEVITSENYSDFLKNYGDVKFTFRDVSDIEIPDGD